MSDFTVARTKKLVADGVKLQGLNFLDAEGRIARITNKKIEQVELLFTTETVYVDMEEFEVNLADTKFRLGQD